MDPGPSTSNGDTQITPIYVDLRMRIDNPRETLVDVAPHEHRLRVLLVSYDEKQRTNTFEFQRGVNFSVHHLMRGLNLRPDEEIDSIYSVVDIIYNIRYVVHLRQKFNNGVDANGMENNAINGNGIEEHGIQQDRNAM